jgi:hypothetical protein
MAKQILASQNLPISLLSLNPRACPELALKPVVSLSNHLPRGVANDASRSRRITLRRDYLPFPCGDIKLSPLIRLHITLTVQHLDLFI